MNKRQRKKVLKHLGVWKGPRVLNLARLNYRREYEFHKVIWAYAGYVCRANKFSEIPF